LLPDFLPNVFIVRIYATQLVLERIDLLQGELRFPQPVDTTHHIKQPAPGHYIFGLVQKQRLFPFGEHSCFWLDFLIANEKDFAGIRYAV